jgi:MFS family permease
MTTAELSPELQRSGMRYAYAGQAVGALLLMLVAHGAVGTLFIKHLGGPDFLALTLGLLFGFCRLLQIPVSLRVPPPAGKRFMLRCWAVSAGIMGLAAVVPSLMGTRPATPYVVVGVIALATCVNQCGGTFWFPLLHDVVPADRRGRFFGKMRSAWSATLFIAVLLSGWFLGETPATWRYQVVVAVGVVLMLLRNLFIARIPQNHARLADDRAFSDWRDHAKRILRRPEVLRFCVYFSVFCLLGGFLGQPLVLYMRFLGLPTNRNLYVFAFRTVGMIMALSLGGQLVDRIGTKKVFLGAHIGLCCLCFLIVVVSTLPLSRLQLPMALLMMVGGAVGSAAGLANTAHLFHLAPNRGRAFFISISSILIFIGPALTGVIAGTILTLVSDAWRLQIGPLLLNIYQVMLLAAGTGLLLAIRLLRLVDDVRPVNEKRADIAD